MLARSSILHHPLAGQVNLPLLVPSFSSKGFPFGRSKALKHEYSEVAYVLADFASRPSLSALISAYDVHFRHFQAPGLPNGSLESRLRNSRLLFVDSGGYELAHDFDSTEPKAPPYTPKEGFGSEEHLRVLRVLAAKRSRLHLVISNFDHSVHIRPLRERIADARALFQSDIAAQRSYGLNLSIVAEYLHRCPATGSSLGVDGRCACPVQKRGGNSWKPLTNHALLHPA